MSPRLQAPGGGQPRPFRKPDVSGRPDEKRVPDKLVQTDAIVLAQIARLAAEENIRTDLRHHRDRTTDRGLLLRCCGTRKARPFRLIHQIDSGDGKIGNQFPVKRQRQVGTDFAYQRSGDLIDTISVSLNCECQAERGCVAIENSVAQIDGSALPSQLAAILKIGDAADIVGRKCASQLDPEVPGGQEFQLQALIDRPVAAPVFGKPSGCLALEFAFADTADVSADPKSKQMLGIDSFSVKTGWEHQRATQDGRHQGFWTNRHSHSNEWKRQCY